MAQSPAAPHGTRSTAYAIREATLGGHIRAVSWAMAHATREAK